MLDHISFWDALKWLFGLVLALGSWVYVSDRKDVREKHDAQDRRIKRIEDEYVGTSTITRMEAEWKEEMGLLRQDRREYQEEIRNTLAEIKRSIDENEERDARTRHDIRDSVHAIALKLAVLDATHSKRPPQ